MRKIRRLILSDDVTFPELKDDNTYSSEIIPMIDKIERHSAGLFVTDHFGDNIDISMMCKNASA